MGSPTSDSTTKTIATKKKVEPQPSNRKDLIYSLIAIAIRSEQVTMTMVWRAMILRIVLQQKVASRRVNQQRRAKLR